MIELFVKRRVLTVVLVLIAAIMGGLSYMGLGARRFPNVEFPLLTVVTVYQGASPSEIETQITKRIEDAIIGISGIEKVTSNSQQGLSLIVVEFDLDQDIDIKAVDVQNKIDSIRYLLPEDAEDPIPQKFEIGSLPVIDLAVFGQRDINELYRIADQDLEPILSQVPGVAAVTITGGQEREIHVLLEARKLRKHHVSIGRAVAALRAANVDVPAGHITQPGREYVIRAPGRFRRVEDIEKVSVPAPGEGIVTIADLGRVEDTYEEARTRSRFNGKPAVVLSIQARSDANEVEVANGIYAVFGDLRARLPQGAKLEVARDTSPYIKGALANVGQNMMIGIALTALTIFLFLKSYRATVIIAIVMPAAVVISFLGMKASGFTLNIISLTGLAIVIGVLVNNAILILENINAFLDRGMEPVEAAVAGTKDIALAIFSSTATNLVVFLPIAFMGEVIGRFFKELGLTVVYATVVSLLLSFSLTPMMCGWWLRAGRESGSTLRARLFEILAFGWLADLWRAAFSRVRASYTSVLDGCLAHRVTTVLATFVAFVMSFGGFVLVGMEFFPQSDEGRFVVLVETPVGTPLEVTDGIVRRIEAQVSHLKDLVNYTVRVGRMDAGSSGRNEGVDLAQVSVTVVDRALREESLDDILNDLRPKLASIPGAKIRLQKEQGGGGEDPINVEVVGDDLNDMDLAAGKVMQIVRSVPGTAGVKKSLQTGQPEVRIIVNQEEANRQGLTKNYVSNEIRSYIEGTTAAEYLDGDENYDVVCKLREQDRDWATDIQRLFVASPLTGRQIRLGQVATIERASGSALITRKDRRRLISVTAGLTGERPLGKVQGDIARRIKAEVALPTGVSIDYGGQVEMMRKNFAEIFKAMAIAAVLTFLCVAGIIESWSLALIILASVPVCLIGVSAALVIYNVTLNMFSLMAMVILVGMVVNNSIIVIDYAARLRAAGQDARTAIREACANRFRMIIMANMTTIVALIPLSLGLGFGGEIFRPLAVVQIGGVAAAAGLSLLVIPAVYTMVDDLRHAIGLAG